MTDPKNVSPEPLEAREDSGLFDLSALMKRYERVVPEGRAEDFGPSWTPAPVLGGPPAQASRSPAWSRLAWILGLFALGGVFAIGNVSGVVAARQLGAQAPTQTVFDASKTASSASTEPEVSEPEITRRETTEPEVIEPAPTAVTPRPRTPRRATPRPVTRAPDPVAPSTPAHRWETGGPQDAPLDRDLDTLLDGALGGAPEEAPALETPRAQLPQTPTARQVRTTLRALSGEVEQCAPGGDVTARVVIDGATGHVSSARVSGSPQAACMESVLETARFPRFEREAFTVLFPYRW